MNLVQELRGRLLRIDARSLGLFRISFGAVLIADLLGRLRWARELYSNEGVLPNHAHLYALRDKGHFWSLLHAVSTPAEAKVALLLCLGVYLGYLIGFRTRLFQALSLLVLVSLTGRNLLLENAGNHLAIGLLCATLFLPLGSRFSLDAVLQSMSARDEKDAAALDDRRRPSAESIEEARLPGWSPTSLAALSVVLHLVMVHLASATLRRPVAAWREGSALHYALQSERWVSGLGAAVRDSLGPSALVAWAHAFRAAEWAIPILVLIPIFPRATRGAAVALALFHGLTIGLFFSFGLYGFTLCAAAALFIPKGTWDRLEGHPDPRRTRTMIYDADCGVCLLTARILKRLDLRHNIVFQGNDDLAELRRRRGDQIARAPMPPGVTADLVESTVLAIDGEGRIHARSRAIAALLAALPLGWAVAWVLRLPGVTSLADLGYDFIASRRQRISVALGKEACGIPGLGGAEPEADPTRVDPISPATRVKRWIGGVLRDLGAITVLAAALAQTAHENPLGLRVPQPRWLAGVAEWPRMREHWDVLVTPPTMDEALVVDAALAGGKSVDPLTGEPPNLNQASRRGNGLGPLWNDYLHGLRLGEHADFRRAFQDYLTREGPRWRDPGYASALLGYDTWWLKQPIPRPGEPRDPARARREKWITHGRGGRAGERRGGHE